MFTAADIVRFWEHVDASEGANACWPWKLGVDKDGYGKFTTTRDGKQTHHRAHRVSLKVAAIPRDRWEAEFAKEFTRAFLLRNIMERAVIADRKTRKER